MRIRHQEYSCSSLKQGSDFTLLVLTLAVVCLLFSGCATPNPYLEESERQHQIAVAQEKKRKSPKVVQTVSQPKVQTQPEAQTRVITRAQPSQFSKNSSIVQLVRKQIGTPYRYGGTTPGKGFDCSGLIFWVYKQNGVSIPRVARDQAKFGSPVSKNRLKPGDIVAFRIRSGYHTGIYSGNGKFIHSPRRGAKVREESLDNSYWKRHYIGARRVLA